MRLIQIHAGIHKTGSTAIQQKLARLAPDLAGHGIALPNFGSRGHQHHTLAAFKSEPEACADAWAKIARRVRQSDPARVILSSEHFVSADPVSLKAALETLGPHDLRLQFYVRPHIALFTSLYLQRIKAGAVAGSATDVAESYSLRPEFAYVPTIERFIDVFGPDAVRVREFNPDRFVDGSLIADVWDYFDLPKALLAKARLDGDAIVNPTPTAEQATLLLALGRHLRRGVGRLADPRPIRRALATLMGDLCARLTGPSTSYRLPVALQGAIKGQTEPDRAEFARYLDRPASPAFLDEPVVAPVPLAPVPFDAVAASLAATIAFLHKQGWADCAAATERFAAGLRSAQGPDGARTLRMPVPYAHSAEGMA
jgi:hypothetical protein